MLKDAAINWVRSNCTDPKLQVDLSRKLKDVLQRKVDCWFAVGQALTRERVPYMIHCFAGQLFIFQLSNAQAAGLMLAPDAMAACTDPRPAAASVRATPQLMSLSKFELDKPSLTPNDRITGSVDYEIEGEIPAVYCLRLDCSLGLSGDETSWTSPEQVLSRAGQFRFSFDALRESAWPFVLHHRGPLALFLRVYSHATSDDIALRRPISDTCGTLVDVGPAIDKDSYGGRFKSM